MSLTDLAVIGAGPAGLAAAIAAVHAGVRVTLIDEYASPGGQYLKGAGHANATSPISAAERQGRALLQDLTRLPVELRPETLVWGLVSSDPDHHLKLALFGPAGVDWLTARSVVVATGAREMVLPFPGWTLPGVMTAGAMQLLAKDSDVLPGRRILLAGSGPLLLAAANELAGRGAQIEAVLEATHLLAWLQHGPAVWGNWDRLREGWRYLRDLYRAGIPYRFGRTVSRALGTTTLEAVVLTGLDREGRPTPGSEETIEVDGLGLSFGFLPNIELTRLAGCNHKFDPARGGWVPQVNERQETSVTGLFVAGEVAGIGGAGLAILEGRLAGLAAAQRLGYVTEAELERTLARLAASRQAQRRFGAMLNMLFRPQPGLEAITTADTLICRCEEVPAGEIRTAVEKGAQELDTLKIWTRVGQGPCQGRICGPLLARLLARQSGRTEEATGFFNVRPPLKPVLLGDLARGENE